jgi:cyclophilin family peptidyl-prolyl cis-trans isomerase
MARLPDDINPKRSSSGSQFYVCLDDAPHLDGGYTVWAQVTRGMEVVLKLRDGDIIEKIEIKPMAEDRHGGQ